PPRAAGRGQRRDAARTIVSACFLRRGSGMWSTRRKHCRPRTFTARLPRGDSYGGGGRVANRTALPRGPAHANIVQDPEHDDGDRGDDEPPSQRRARVADVAVDPVSREGQREDEERGRHEGAVLGRLLAGHAGPLLEPGTGAVNSPPSTEPA